MDLNPEALATAIGALLGGLGVGAATTHKIIKKALVKDIMPMIVTGVCPAPECLKERTAVAKSVITITEKVSNLEKFAADSHKLGTENAQNLSYIAGQIDEALKGKG